eukprot:2657612-Pyramimonas_sp.AAC.1
MASAPNCAELAVEFQAAVQWTADQLKHLMRGCAVENNFQSVTELLASITDSYTDKVYAPKAKIAMSVYAPKAKIAMSVRSGPSRPPLDPQHTLKMPL